MNKVRTIIWDLDNTVWFYNNNETNVLCKKLNIEQKETFKQEYYKMWSNLFLYFKDTIVTYDKMKEFIEKEIPTLKANGVSPEELLEALITEKRKMIKVNQEAIEMMSYFSEKGYVNICITDWFEKDQQKALEEINAITFIHKIYGCDNTFFKDSFEKVKQIKELLELEKRKEEFVMIGDSLTSDISFAERLGIKSIWYNRNGEKNTTSNIPTLEVSSLLELKSIL